MTVGQQTVVANALKAGRQRVQQEAANEFLRRNRHHFGTLWMSIVLPSKRYLAVLQRQQALIGDGHAMRVAAQIIQYLLRTAEGWLGVDHPFLLFQRSQVCSQIPVEEELPAAMNFSQAFQKQPAEQAAEYTHGEKEAGSAGHPLTVGREPASRHDAVQVRMEMKVLSPGVKDGEEADLRAQMLGIAGDDEERFRYGAEEKIIDRVFVVERNAGDLLG